jgi:hypothetical protein
MTANVFALRGVKMLDKTSNMWYDIHVGPNAGLPTQRETFKSGAENTQSRSAASVDAYLHAYLDHFRSVQALRYS